MGSAGFFVEWSNVLCYTDVKETPYMTTTTKKRRPQAAKAQKPVAKTARISKPKPKKPLRIREELLPRSARYITIDDIEYVAMPVADFGEWYEDVELGAVLDDRQKNAESTVPFDQAVKEIKASRKAKP